MRGTLPSTNVVLITTADADPADRDAVLSLLNRAGATVTAQLQLTEAFTDPIRADELRSLAAQTLPTGVTLPEVQQVGAVAGGLLGAVLVAGADGAVVSTPEQSAAALAAFTSGGFIAVTGTPAAGRSVIILTGGEVTGCSEGDRAAAVSDLATELKKSAAGVVVAGRSGSDGRDRRRRGDPQRHDRQRGGQHGRQRGLGGRADRDGAGPRRAERRRSRPVRLRGQRAGAGPDARGGLNAAGGGPDVAGLNRRQRPDVIDARADPWIPC